MGLEACDSRINDGGRCQGHKMSLWTKLGFCSGETSCAATSGSVKNVRGFLFPVADRIATDIGHTLSMIDTTHCGRKRFVHTPARYEREVGNF